MHRSFPEPYLLFHVESRATPRFDRSSPSSVRLQIRLVEHELAPPQKKFPGQGKRGQEKPASPASMQRIPGGGVRGVSDDSASRVVQRFHLLTRKSSADSSGSVSRDSASNSAVGHSSDPSIIDKRMTRRSSSSVLSRCLIRRSIEFGRRVSRFRRIREQKPPANR